MTTSANSNVVAKIAAVVAGLGLVAMAFAPAAKADSTSDLQAQIASLLAQIASLQAQLGTTTTTSTGSMMFTTDLTLGSKGASVTALQNWLISKGFTISAGATGYFGAQTKAALAAYQASVGISPAAGYFGPVTRAKVNASAGTTTTTTTGGTTTTTTGPLSGAEGSIDNFKTIGASTTSLNAADSDQVLGFEFKADGSDLQVNRVDFDVTGNGTGTIRPWGVFQTATLMDGTKTIGTVDATNQANWSQDGTVGGIQTYRVRFDGLNDVVKMGSTADFYLTLSTQSSISNSNSGGTYTITLPNQGLRAVDAKGIQQYSSATVTTTALVTNTTSGSVVLSTGSDNPQTTTVQGDSNTSTTGITVNTFTLQAKDADVMLYSLPVRVATSTVPAGEVGSSIVRTLKLYQGSTLLDTESVTVNSASAATTTFQNLNFKISQGSTVPFKIVAEINKVGGSGFPEGSGITVTVPGIGIDVENGSNTVSVTGAATGNTITFRSLGLSADAAPTTNVSLTTNGNSAQQTGTFTLTFNVTAFGQDVYISSTTNGFTTKNQGVLGPQVVDQSGAATTTAASSISSTADRSTLNNYVIHSGQTKSVTIQLTKVGQSGVAQAILSTLLFGTTDTNPLSSSIALPTAYQTAQQYLAD
ncbi:MAG: baaA1 [Parcubacteria group bacterium]|nr:baaA1 [Parcubacteria group bacterium]